MHPPQFIRLVLPKSGLTRRTTFGLSALAFVLAPGIVAAAEGGGNSLGHQLALGWLVPFLLMLVSIAFLPLVVPHWWESNLNKGIVSVIFGVPVALYVVRLDPHRVGETGIEYCAFIALLAALFVISGGIYLRGALGGTPVVNTLILGSGAVLANVIGTTGASMVLIRPMLRANATRRRQTHIMICFIFVVSNIGGLLTPLGDPPLFLGFLRGVPFEWTLRLLPHWLLMNLSLLAVFYLWDRRLYQREGPATTSVSSLHPQSRGFTVEGKINLLLLLGVIAVALVVARFGEDIGLGSQRAHKWAQVIGMTLLAAFSFLLTPSATRAANRFTFHPILEVAVLFAGIFATMIPALAILEARGHQFGLQRPWQFFWATGLLSSVLDNAPTYLAFSAAASGLMGTDAMRLDQLLQATREGVAGESLLKAISVGAVFMGANTYIGNGPNFLVKSIAEEAGVKMPSFLGYVRYAVMILFPLLILVTLLFFRS